MEKQEHIDRLRELEDIPELQEGFFGSQEDAVTWAAEVAPLLRFDEGYHGEFRNRAQKLNFNFSEEFQASNLRRMAAIVLEPPQHVTLAWLWNHVPWAVWVSLGAALCVAFVAGITFGRSDLYERLTTPHNSAASGPGKATSK